MTKHRPTVILDGPCAALRDAVAAFAPVFVFKPQEVFFSHPNKAAEELHRALAAKKAAPPYIFVAASFGGFAALAYANRYPATLAGLVLVDASHPKQSSSALAAIPADAPASPAVEAFKKHLKGFGPLWIESCTAIAEIRELGDIPLIVLAAGNPDMPAELKSETREALTRSWHALQRQHAALSTRGEMRIVPGAGHNLVQAAPGAIEAAIRELVGRCEK
jgi:pimeloyl-ACP methyl ester carboxylesterase